MSETIKIACGGYEIFADWYQGSSTDEVMLVLQGFTSSRIRQSKFTEFMMHETGASALVIDYTGHGDSPFELIDTRPAQHLLEVMSAYDWIKNKLPAAKITVLGNSYGSFLSAHLLQYRPIEKLVLRAPAIYRPEAFYDLWALRFADEDAYRESIMGYRSDKVQMGRSPLFRSRELNTKTPTLVVIHELDEIIPLETAQMYADSFSADTYLARGFKHAVSASDLTDAQVDEYHAAIADWLKSA